MGTRGAPDVEAVPLAEQVCLALVAQGATHGWELGSLLAPDAEVGRVWSLSRPLTYRAVDRLVERRLLRRAATPAASGRSGGRERRVLAVTAAGRRMSDAWLRAPVAHLRQVRTELLVKLVLSERAGLDVAPLLADQQAAFAERIGALTATSGDPGDLVALWRRESARAVRRFLDVAQAGGPGPAATGAPSLSISARNQLRATITAIAPGDVLSTVRAVLGDGQAVTAVITRDSIDHLDLAPGDDVVVVVKSTEVMVAKP